VIPPRGAGTPEPRIVLGGLAMAESPRWHAGRLWPPASAGEVIAVDADGNGDGSSGHRRARSRSTGDGRLLVLSGHDGRLLRREPDGTLVVHADLAGISGHAWNELVVDGQGSAWVNNIGFDFPDGEPTTGIIARVAPDGSARQVADGVAFPNGMVVTPDDATLVVAESYGRKLTAFDIDPDGGLSNRRVWADLGDGYPDGICLDAEGAIWYADVPSRRCVRVREGGEVLQVVDLDRGCFACMLGGADGRTLFLLANDWRGPEHISDDATPSGRVLAVGAPAPRAGRP
jgi:sugar lactone lactonase YvrE